MDSKGEDGNLNDQVSSRLDELFREDEPEEQPAREKHEKTAASPPGEESFQGGSSFSEKRSGNAAPSPVEDLKALVFSMDWEITEKTMKDFLEEVKRLKSNYKDDKISLTFLKLQESLGRYIKSRKAKAHPDSIKLIASVFNQFEKTLASPDLGREERKRLLSAEMSKFKSFKESLSSAGKKAAASAPVSGESAPEPRKTRDSEAPSGIAPEYRELADYFVSEVRKAVREEIQKLKSSVGND